MSGEHKPAPVHLIRNRSRCECGTYRVGYMNKVAPATTDPTQVTCARCKRTAAYKALTAAPVDA
jgi:hypothetical protein